MNRDEFEGNTSDMASISRGLEEFLEKEIADSGYTNWDEKPKKNRTNNRREDELDIPSFVNGGNKKSPQQDIFYNMDEDEFDVEDLIIEEASVDYDLERLERQRALEAKRKRQQARGNQDNQRKFKKLDNDRLGNDGGNPNGGQPAPSTPKRKKKKNSRIKRFFKKLAILVAVFLVLLFVAVNYAYSKLNYEPIESLTHEPMKEEGVTNILLIGNDSRENGEDGRSDAMIILSISNRTKKIYMTSVLRDMYVEIPGYKDNRLNAAYSFGGPELLMETIEKNLGISINRYVLVNFEAFANLVDAVGGVKLDLTNDEVYYVNGYLVEYNILLNRPQGTDNLDSNASGMIHLNGAQALAYSRNRYIGTDFGRTERQRKVLSQVISKLPKAVIFHPFKLINGLMPNLTTNLKRGECFRLSLQAWKFIAYGLEQDFLPVQGSYHDARIRDMAVLEVDFEANRRHFRETVYGQ